MKKGIFWMYVTVFDYDLYVHNIVPVMVECDNNGNPLEDVVFSSKSGDNFNHKIEWKKQTEYKYDYNFFPRGRVEIKNGKIKIYANPVIIAEEEAKNLIIETFELADVVEEIKWIADNSRHYQYDIDIMR